MNGIALLDIILFILLVLLTLRASLRGFVKEFFSLGAPVLGILAAIFSYKYGAAFIRANYIRDEAWGLPEVLAFAIIFILAFIACKIVQKILDDVIKGLNLTGLDKLLGGVIGLAEGFIVISVVLIIIYIQPVFDSMGLLLGSISGRYLLPLIIDNTKVGIDTILNSVAMLLHLPFYFG